jgi:hypothetical protein
MDPRDEKGWEPLLYTNQITKVEKTFFWSVQTIGELGLLGGFRVQ